MIGARPFPFSNLGRITETGDHPLLVVPVEGPGFTLRAVVLSFTSPPKPHTKDFWLVSLMALEASGRASSLWTVSTSTWGLGTGYKRFQMPQPVSLKAGQVLALRLQLNGQPPALEGLSIAPEYATLRDQMETA